jgi:hypothetical protein
MIMTIALGGSLIWASQHFSLRQQTISQKDVSCPVGPHTGNHQPASKPTSSLTGVPGQSASEASGTSPDHCDDGPEDRTEFWPVFGRRLKITDTLLAVFTFLLLAAAIWQGIQLKRTVDSAERSNSILYRAYFWPGFARASPLPQNGWRYYVTFSTLDGRLAS